MSARAPTSTPRVGSISTKTSASARCQRASSAFCWLPPDSVRIGASSEAATTPKSRPHSLRRRALLGAASTMPSEAGAVAERGDGDVLAQRQVGQDALVLAVFGEQADAGGDRVVRAAQRRATLSPTLDDAGVGAQVAADQPGDLVLPGAEQAGQRQRPRRAGRRNRRRARALPQPRPVDARSARRPALRSLALDSAARCPPIIASVSRASDQPARSVRRRRICRCAAPWPCRRDPAPRRSGARRRGSRRPAPCSRLIASNSCSRLVRPERRRRLVEDEDLRDRSTAPWRSRPSAARPATGVLTWRRGSMSRPSRSSAVARLRCASRRRRASRSGAARGPAPGSARRSGCGSRLSSW